LCVCVLICNARISWDTGFGHPFPLKASSACGHLHSSVETLHLVLLVYPSCRITPNTVIMFGAATAVEALANSICLRVN